LRSLAHKAAAEAGVPPEPEKPVRSVKKTGSSASVFDLAKGVPTERVLGRVGFSVRKEGEKFLTTCVGCKNDDSLVCEPNGGTSCFHNTCHEPGSTETTRFRSNVDIVAESLGMEPLEAAFKICEWEGIEVPKPATKDVPFMPGDDEATGDSVSSVAGAVASTPVSIIESWRQDGPLRRIPTGIEALDGLCRGGLPVPWRVTIVGAPSAGKTATEVCIADRIARAAGSAGACVGILGVDEEPEDLTVRLVQIAGFSVHDAEQRDPDALDRMAAAVGDLRVRLYDGRHTIEAAGAAVADWAKLEGRPGVLFIDSIQAASSVAASRATGPREKVEGNINAMRRVSTSLRLLVIATSEANRNAYRNDAAAAESNDLAAGAESRAIEFGSQTQLMLRTPKDHPDVIHVRIAKNRRAYIGEFWLRLDREGHRLTETTDPLAGPAADEDREHGRQAATSAAVQRDAKALATLLAREPDGLGERDLRAALRDAGHKWGVDRLNAARRRLGGGLGGVRLVQVQAGRANVSKVVPDTDTRGET